MIDPKPVRFRLIRFGTVLMRWVLCSLILMLGFELIVNIRVLLRPDDSTDGSVKVAKDVPDIAANFQPAELWQNNGFWTFAGWQWELKKSVASSPSRDLLPPSGWAVPSTVNPSEIEFLSLLKKLGATEQTIGSWTTVTLSQNDLCLTVLTHSKRTDRFCIAEAQLAIRAAQPGKWTTFRLRRRASGMETGLLQAGVIPVIGGDAIACRTSDSREPTAEVRRGCGEVSGMKRRLAAAGYALTKAKGGLGNTWIATNGERSALLRELSREAGGIVLVSRMD